MRTIVLTFAILFFFSPLSHAQYKELLKNDQITWVAEFEMDMSFDSDQSSDGIFDVTLKKYVRKNNFDAIENGDWIPQYLFDHILKGEVLSFETAGLINPYRIDELYKIASTVDTVITFDPNTGIEQKQMVKNEINVMDIVSCRTKQIIYLEERTNRLQTQLIAIAPLIQMRDEHGMSTFKKPMAWIRIEDIFGEKIDENSPLVSWAASISNRKLPLDFSQLTVVKGNLDFRKYLTDETLYRDFEIIGTESGYDSDDLMTQEEFENVYGVHVDTVITFDPTTYEEIIQVVKHDYAISETNHCRLAQDWYYLPEKRLIINRLRAVAPLYEQKDEEGNFLFFQPMYHIRFSK